ncbi:AraC family transcriptional regulator, partial [Geminicoccus flavidas]|uniref:AraC family transcriptional regulator n=1 Tax=Geminicoccus flavidas TaxID=2506407 RepID=UPI001F44C0CC
MSQRPDLEHFRRRSGTRQACVANTKLPPSEIGRTSPFAKRVRMSEQNRSQPEIVAFLLVPSFTMIAFAAALEPLRIANRMSGKELYRWVILSKDGQPVASSVGIETAVDLPMGKFEIPASQPPTIVVCGGLHSERYQDKEVLAWLRWADRRGAQIGSICAGAHILG